MAVRLQTRKAKITANTTGVLYSFTSKRIHGKRSASCLAWTFRATAAQIRYLQKKMTEQTQGKVHSYIGITTKRFALTCGLRFCRNRGFTLWNKGQHCPRCTCTTMARNIHREKKKINREKRKERQTKRFKPESPFAPVKPAGIIIRKIWETCLRSSVKVASAFCNAITISGPTFAITQWRIQLRRSFGRARRHLWFVTWLHATHEGQQMPKQCVYVFLRQPFVITSINVFAPFKEVKLRNCFASLFRSYAANARTIAL